MKLENKKNNITGRKKQKSNFRIFKIVDFTYKETNFK